MRGSHAASSSKEEAPFPRRQCVVLALCNAAHFYTICSLFAYAGFLVVDLGWEPDVDAAGYVVGYLGTSLVLGRLLDFGAVGAPGGCFWQKTGYLTVDGVYSSATWLLVLQKRSTPH